MQASRVTYDSDTGVLDLRLDTGDEYRIENAGVARKLKDKISVGGRISPEQRHWLERYKVAKVKVDRSKLLERLAVLRKELKR